MNLLIIDQDCVGLSLAWRCAQAGHKVKWFISPRPRNNQETGEGFRNIEKVDNWVQHVKWADLIWCTSNDQYIERLENFRKRGYPYFGPSVASANLEIKRADGMKMLEKAGIDVVPYKTFKSLKEAYNHVKKTGERYVFKTLGDNEDKSLTYCSKDAADMMNKIKDWIEKGVSIKGEVMLQEFIKGIEFGVSRWMGRDGWVGQWNESFEHKKLMSGNFGQNTGEMGTVAGFVPESKIGKETLAKLEQELLDMGHMGDIALGFMVPEDGTPRPTEFTCYDKETEVLTENGWKLFKDCKVGELAATLNPSTNFLEYHTIENVIEKEFSGDMIHFHGDRSAPDLMVTPDHSMWAMDGNKKEWGFQSAERVAKSGNWKIKRSASWNGKEVQTFTLPGYVEIHKLNMKKMDLKEVEIDHPEISMPMDVWLKFLGLYISEGSMGNRCKKGISYIVNISQIGWRKDRVRDSLKNFPIDLREPKNGSGFQFLSRQLCLYLHHLNLGTSEFKHIPKELMDLSSRQLNILLDHLMMGDGTTHKRTGQRTYTTTSIKLAGQVQELILKTGGMGRIIKSDSKGTKMSVKGGKEYTRNHDVYDVMERKKLIDGWTDRRMAHRIPYNDMVYCLNVPPHHLLYVRRNGNPSWCGNCRPGWPIFNMMLGSIKGDPCEWMLDAYNGKDTTTFSEEIGTCFVVAHGDFPSANMSLDDLSGLPIRGITKSNKQHLHPQSVKIIKKHDMAGEAVIEKPVWCTSNDYVMVVTGFGKDVKQSRDRAFKTLKQLHISNMIARDDIGEDLEQQLPELHKHGYATHFEYDTSLKKKK